VEPAIVAIGSFHACALDRFWEGGDGVNIVHFLIIFYKEFDELLLSFPFALDLDQTSSDRSSDVSSDVSIACCLQVSQEEWGALPVCHLTS
jgi:hypothetical protein